LQALCRNCPFRIHRFDYTETNRIFLVLLQF
jgi:hypothetical protein